MISTYAMLDWNKAGPPCAEALAEAMNDRMKTETRFITARALSVALGMNPRTFKRKLHESGLAAAIDKTCLRPVRLDRERARQVLEKLRPPQ